jgi:DNA recombination protein RmuC
METALVVLLCVAILAVVALALRRGGGASAEDVDRSLAPLQAELARLSHQQDELRSEATHGRETWLVQLGSAARDIRGDIGEARRALAEVKAFEEGRARQMDKASDSLRRLEAIIAGSGSRGAAGENILVRSLAQLPPDLLEVNAAFGSKIVEYALRLPDGRLLPIDSKWPGVAALERLEETDDPVERRRLIEQIARDVRGRIREMSKYLDPERTFSLGLLAVPDAVYLSTPEVHGEGFREGVLVAPYSLALPLLLTLYRLAVRFGSSADAESIAESLRELAERLHRIDEEVEGRLSRGLVQLENSRDALRSEVGLAQRAAGRSLAESGARESLESDTRAEADTPPGAPGV